MKGASGYVLEKMSASPLAGTSVRVLANATGLTMVQVGACLGALRRNGHAWRMPDGRWARVRGVAVAGFDVPPQPVTAPTPKKPTASIEEVRCAALAVLDDKAIGDEGARVIVRSLLAGLRST